MKRKILTLVFSLLAISGFSYKYAPGYKYGGSFSSSHNSSTSYGSDDEYIPTGYIRSDCEYEKVDYYECTGYIEGDCFGYVKKSSIEKHHHPCPYHNKVYLDNLYRCKKHGDYKQWSSTTNRYENLEDINKNIYSISFPEYIMCESCYKRSNSIDNTEEGIPRVPFMFICFLCFLCFLIPLILLPPIYINYRAKKDPHYLDVDMD